MERLLQEFIDLMPVGVSVADRHGRFVRMNCAARRIWRVPTNLELRDLSSLPAWNVDSGEKFTAADWGLRRALTQGEGSDQLLRVRYLDGSERSIATTAAPLYGEQDQLTGAVLIHEDVTEFLAMRMLSESRRELLQTVLDLLPVGVLRFDQDGALIEANAAARRLWGLDEHSPLPAAAEFHARDVATGERVMPEGWAAAHAMAHGGAWRNELLEIHGFDGSRHTVFNSAAPLYLHQATPVGAIAVNQDVSSLHRTQQQLRTAVRDREQLLALVSHDLRSPLAGLMLLAESIENLASGTETSAEVAALAGRVQERVHGLAGLVDDLLAISAGGLADASMLDLQKTEPEQLVELAVEHASELFDAKGIQLKTRVARGLPPVMADQQRLQRVWTNLLDNALKHTSPGGKVVVGATGLSAVAFSVSNSGPALSGEQMQNMFQPFWQASRDKRGVGLGLSIARAIVEAHGGSIWAEPAEDQCVCMKFELPRIELSRPDRQAQRSMPTV